MIKSPIVFAFSALFGLISTHVFAAECTPQSMNASASYSRIFQKACHNCYEKQYATTFISVFNDVDAVEIDFYDTQDKVSGAKDYSWYVRHGWGTLFQSGNDNNCTGDGTGKNDLKACLKDVKAASDAHPGHDIYVVYMDKKQNWGKTREPVDLDGLIASIFPDSMIFRPKTLRGSYSTARAAAQAGDWPSYSSLKNKVMFVLTGDDAMQNKYVSERGDNAVIFAAPNTDDAEDITGTPDKFNDATAGWVVVYNIKDGHQKLGPTAHEKHYISRLWGSKEDSATYTANLKQCINFIALYNFKQTGFNGGTMDGTFK